MPRRRQRFSQLERELRASGYAPPAGSRAAAYLDFKKGVNKIDVKNAATSAERARKGVALLPFGMLPPDAVTAAHRYVASITALSNTGRLGFGLSNNDLGYEALAAGNKNPGNFYPPLLKVFNRTSMNTTSPTSGILKKEYNRYPGRNYSIPFGRSATVGGGGFTIKTIGEEDAKSALIDQIVTAERPLVLVSYEPELFTSPKKDLASLL